MLLIIIMFIIIMGCQNMAEEKVLISSTHIVMDSVIQKTYTDSAKFLPYYKYEELKFDTSFNINNDTYSIHLLMSPMNKFIIYSDYKWYDNFIQLEINKNGNLFVSQKYEKEDFKNYLPREVLEQYILSDITFDGVIDGFVFTVWLGSPDTDIGNYYLIKFDFEGNQFIEGKEIIWED